MYRTVCKTTKKTETIEISTADIEVILKEWLNLPQQAEFSWSTRERSDLVITTTIE